MKIQPNLVYSKNEVSELLNIHPRKLNRIAQRHNIEKVDNRYIFKGSFLIEHFKLDVSKGVQSVSKDFQEIPTEAAPTTEALKQLIEKFTISEIQEIDLKLKDKGELSNIGNLWFVKKGVMLQEYTPTEYDIAFKRLTEWRLQQKEIEKQAAEISEIKVSSTERVEHYKNLFEYQRKQSDRILQIHEKLVGSLNELTKGTIQRNVIEAKEKGVINEDWKPTED
tara:strand:+ start:561 stop:1229 length:669 start_codon:yes stop_codon:yes gene_type:complete